MKNPGWIDDPPAVEAVCVHMQASGTEPLIAEARPELRGYWSRLVDRGTTGVFLSDAERELFGDTPADHQRRGTCVGRGTYRAAQDSYLFSIWKRGVIGQPKRICFEPIYAGARVAIGRGRLSGDGAVGAWAAEYVRRGVVTRGRYGSHDLTLPNEQLAVSWGTRGRGVPRAVEDAMRGHEVVAHRCMSAEDIADCVAAGFGVAYCSRLLWGNRGPDGISEVIGTTAHCEEICGVAVDARGEWIFLRQQSWGNKPGGPRQLTYKGGIHPLRQGEYGARFDDINRGLRNGEAWAFQVTDGKGWRPLSA